MLKVKRHKLFIKELRNAKLNDQLPIEALDHPLKGEYQYCREFHISGDLLIIYFIDEDTLNLIRIGSHSQLFK